MKPDTATYFTVRATTPSDAAAISAYAAMGFEVIDRIEVRLGLDQTLPIILMRRSFCSDRS